MTCLLLLLLLLLILLVLAIFDLHHICCLHEQGSCISGIIGTKNVKFSLFGDDVVTAATMEKTGTPDCIHASSSVVDLVPDEDWVACQVLDVPGCVGLQTYLLGGL